MAYTTIDDSSAYFQIALYTGTGSSHAITNGGNSDLQPDLVWIKKRNDTGDHNLTDSSRGVQVEFALNINPNPGSDVASTNGLTAFNSDGFTVGSEDHYNASSDTFAAYQWKCNGGTTSTNDDGNLDATVQVNTTAGFSIIAWENGSTGTSITVGHGLGVAPQWFFVKRHNGSGAITGYHEYCSAGGTLAIFPSSKAQTADNSTYWQDTAPTSTVISVGSDTNYYASEYYMWAWAPVQGFSKFSGYVGNGDADGPFVYTGFKPAFLWIHKFTGGGAEEQWTLNDSARDSNLNDTSFFTSVTEGDDAEATSDNTHCDLLSNGFKLRGTDRVCNGDDFKYIYIAFAENPFVTSEGIPCTAR